MVLAHLLPGWRQATRADEMVRGSRSWLRRAGQPNGGSSLLGMLALPSGVPGCRNMCI